MLKIDAYQQIEKIAQERGVSLASVAGHLGMSQDELDKVIKHHMTPFAWNKIMGTIQKFSCGKGPIKECSPFDKFCVEKIGEVTDCF